MKQLYEANQEKEEPGKEKEKETDGLNLLKGEVCINCLTQYPKDERKAYMIPFVNLLHEKIEMDGSG